MLFTGPQLQLRQLRSPQPLKQLRLRPRPRPSLRRRQLRLPPPAGTERSATVALFIVGEVVAIATAAPRAAVALAGVTRAEGRSPLLAGVQEVEW